MLALPWILLFGFVVGSILLLVGLFVGTIMLFFFFFIQAFGWLSTIAINEIVIQSSVGGFAIAAYDILVAPAIGIWIIVYCFAGISGYDGKGCTNGVNGLIPYSSTTTTT